ncbi:conserved protein, unknown function [Hepatocystis sp. ex Piliocolobus tephrosceles]|nr:conserved protein, unknown function [Hepatocystis sp. ex Piliocolobus tephrosceles]
MSRKEINNIEDKNELFCFICLENDLENGALVSCCSLCTGRVHVKCWYNLREIQKLSSLRSKLLGLNKIDPLICSICKTGKARIKHEKDMKWLNKNNSNNEYLQDELLKTVASILNSETNENQFSFLHFRHIYFFNIISLMILITVIIILTVVFHFTFTFVFLFMLLLFYEMIVLQIMLYIYIKIRYN